MDPLYLRRPRARQGGPRLLRQRRRGRCGGGGFHSADAHGGLSRLLAVLTVQLDCFVIYTRIASQDNLADQLSRGRPDLFLQQARAAGLSTALSAVQCRSPSAAARESVQCSFY